MEPQIKWNIGKLDGVCLNNVVMHGSVDIKQVDYIFVIAQYNEVYIGIMAEMGTMDMVHYCTDDKIAGTIQILQRKAMDVRREWR